MLNFVALNRNGKLEKKTDHIFCVIWNKERLTILFAF